MVMTASAMFRAIFGALLERYLRMSTAFDHTLILATPPAVREQVASLCAAATLRPLEDWGFTLQVAPGGVAPAAYLVGSGVYTSAQVDALRPLFQPGGAAYLLGARGRRMLNAADPPETVVIEVGEPIPAAVDWTVTRVSKERFFEEMGCSEVFDLPF